MFMFNYDYSESPAMIIALSVILIIGIIGLGIIICEFLEKPLDKAIKAWYNKYVIKGASAPKKGNK